MLEKVRRNILIGAGLLLAATIALRGGIELFYFDSPRQPDPATNRTVPYVVKNVVIYITENLSDVFYWLQWIFYFAAAVIVASVILNMILPSKSSS